MQECKENSYYKEQQSAKQNYEVKLQNYKVYLLHICVVLLQHNCYAMFPFFAKPLLLLHTQRDNTASSLAIAGKVFHYLGHDYGTLQNKGNAM